VIGSRQELERLSGRDLADLELHRPYVDEVTFACPECGETAHRVPEVIDAWFDSGSMPIAQWHYPFEGKELFAERFPADFICEANRPDAGLVLQPSGRQRPALRTHVVPVGRLPGPHPRRRRPQDVQAVGNVVDPWTVLDAQDPTPCAGTCSR